MADVNSQVALGIVPPDPNATMNSLAKILGNASGILGIRQQQQGLAIQNQELQQKQLQTAQQQGVQNFFESWDPSQHVADDGTVDADSAHNSPAYKSAGNAKPLIDEALLKVKGFQLQNKQALATLDQGLVDQYGRTMGTLADDDDVKAGNLNGQAKVKDAITNFSKLQPEAGRVANIFGTVLNHVTKDEDGTAKNLGHLVRSQQMMAQSASEQQAQQNRVPTSYDTGAQILPATIDRATGVPSLTGQAINKTTPPQITNTPAGLVNVAPGGRSASVIPSAGESNANPSQAQATAANMQSQAVSDRVAQTQAQAANTVQAQDALSRAKAILESGQAPETGANFESKKFIANFLSGVGIDTSAADNMNTLAKNLARYEASRATASGLGGTDAARELAHNGSPNTALDNKALLGIVRQSLAAEKTLAGYADIQSKTNDPQQLLKNERAFRSIPHPIETQEYLMSRSKAEADKYLQEHGLSHSDVVNSANAMKQFGLLP